MSDVAPLGRMLMLLGVALLIIGALLTFAGRGMRLPGDILTRRDTYVIYIPIATSIILSLVLTVLLSLFLRR